MRSFIEALDCFAQRLSADTRAAALVQQMFAHVLGVTTDCEHSFFELLRRHTKVLLPEVEPDIVAQSPEIAAIEPAGPDAPGDQSVRILVVDDNPVNLMVISALLEARGLVSMLAEDGAEAVALASELRFDLILMDLRMPNYGFGTRAEGFGPKRKGTDRQP